MTPRRIQKELKAAGFTQHQLAAELGVCDNHLSQVILVSRPSDRVMRRIAGIIGHKPEEVFPKYYFRKNRRKKAA